ncbi:hypothetical protein [Coleofasciculus sp. FACHB-SPT9]|uniref:hypothetical protein n=1 Tax=Cyanophyceae TaxID=3028117 RepID=UPI0030DABB48
MTLQLKQKIGHHLSPNNLHSLIDSSLLMVAAASMLLLLVERETPFITELLAPLPLVL